MPSKRYWAKQIFNAALVGAAVYVIGGFYGQRLDRDAHRVVLEFDPEMRLGVPLADMTADDRRQIDCLAQNMYFEARGEGKVGMKAVTDVVFNRLAKKGGLYPDTVCDIITQCDPRSGVCQFSWINDGRNHAMRDKAAADEAYDIAVDAWTHRGRMADSTDGATHYHANYVSPKWSKLRETIQIGMHLFFKPKGETQ